jgi:N-acetylglucosamine-6-phosphate deacetylase
MTLFPGFVDVHIHGAMGIDVNAASVEELFEVGRFLVRHGVTAWLPTLVPAPDEDYSRVAKVVASFMSEHPSRPAAARALGLHYEGPFVNRQQCGALREKFFREYRGSSDLDRLATVALPQAKHMITLAPEVEGGIDLVAELARREWVVSIGHTRADFETLNQALAAGARHVTHFPNAMPPLHHRAPGPVGWALLRDEVSVDVIADGVHADPHMLELVLRCKTPTRVALISDAVAPAGLGDGEFRVWDEIIKVTHGRTSNERGAIAGSVMTMDDAVRMMSKLGVAETDIARMSSVNPSRLLGLEGECGSIEEGKRADLTALDAEGNVRLTVIGGSVAFDALDA